MKVIIPLAGKGTRLRPLTFSKPKPLIKVAGKEVLGHILDTLLPLKPEEVVFIIGEMGERIREYVAKNYRFKARFVEQDRLLGDGYALSLAQDYVKGEVLVVFVDTLFRADLSVMKSEDADCIVWVKGTETPERFGVVVTDARGFVAKLVEKPAEFVSNLAVIGLYYFRDARTLFSYLERTIKAKKSSAGEYRLADALNAMAADSVRIKAVEAEVWADCGKPETLLATNRWLLQSGSHRSGKAKNSVIIPPVFIEDSAAIENSIIGPFASIGGNCTIRNSIIKDSIIEDNAVIENAALNNSLIGDSAVVRDTFRRLNVGDNSEIDAD